MNAAMYRLRITRPIQERYIIYNELAALYTPALVQAFKRQIAVNTGAARLLAESACSPHFVRFAKRPEAADLHKLHATRLLDDVWNEGRESFEGELQGSLQFFSTLLLVFGTDFDRDTMARLVRRLKEWKRDYGYDPDVHMYAQRCLDILHPVGAEGADMHARQLPGMRKMLSKGVDSCHFPECDATVSNDGPLKACSKCKVKYCSIEHQRNDWKEHKPFCITPVF